MRKILDYLDQISDELESAKDYAEAYVQLKVDEDEEWALKFKAMSEEELNHASNIHELAAQSMDKVREVCTMPASMQEIWDKAHSRYVEKTAWVRQMLAM